MDKKNLEVNGNLYGVGVAQDGAIVNQNLILPEHKVPAQLTSKLGKDSIIGREKELEEIDDILNNSDSLLLNGIGGIGKSTIASYYLHSQKDKLDYYGFFEGIESFISELRESLNLKQEKQQDAFIEALTKLRKLEGKKLLVIDDVKDIEENLQHIKRILELKNSGYKILLTSREEIEDVEQYYLDVLSMDDAKRLFNSIYEVEDEVLLEEILNYLDCHAFFVEMTAKTLKSKKTLTPEIIKEKFENGEFSTIKRKRKESFNDYLNELFSFDELDDEEILMLKQLSVLPSVEIEFQFLQKIFDRKDDKEFEEILNSLYEKGWLSSFKNGYKLHQILKEYILTNNIVYFYDIEKIFDFYSLMIFEYKFILNYEKYIIFFENLSIVIDLLDKQNEKTVDFIYLLSSVYSFLGRYKKAEILYKKSLSRGKEIFGKNHLRVSEIYNGIALLYKDIQEYKNAEIYYTKSLEVLENLLEPNILKKIDIYKELSYIYSIINEKKQAILMYEKILEIREKFTTNYFETAEGYYDIATYYSIQEKYEQAELFYMKSLAVKSKESDYLNKLACYDALAVLYKKTKKYEQAELFYRHSLRMSQEFLGDYNFITLERYSILASFYKSIRKYTNAEEFYLKYLEIIEIIYGTNHPKLADIYLELSEIYESLKNNKKEKLYTIKYLRIEEFKVEEYEKLVDYNKLNLAKKYKTLGLEYHCIFEQKKAEKFYLKSLLLQEKEFGEYNIKMRDIYFQLANFYESIEIYTKAEFFSMKIVLIHEKEFGKENFDTSMSYFNLARIYNKNEKLKEAQVLLEKSLTINKSLLNKNNEVIFIIKRLLSTIKLKRFLLKTKKIVFFS